MKLNNHPDMNVVENVLYDEELVLDDIKQHTM